MHLVSYKVIQIPKSRKVFLVDSGIVSFEMPLKSEIRNSRRETKFSKEEFEIHKGEIKSLLGENTKSTEGEFQTHRGEIRNPLGENMGPTKWESRIH